MSVTIESMTSESDVAPDGRRTILFVEDNEDNRAIYTLFLEQRGGFRVLHALDGQEGIDMARRERPDLILMDVSIPVIDGLDATRILRADPATAHIPIIAVTAHAMLSDREKAMEAGCDGYIAKPAEPQVVLAAVQQLLGSEPR